jgi:translation initiation factor 4E
MFRDGIRPEWEDPANDHGGKWVMSFTRTQKATLDRLWLYLVLAVIGEQFRDSHEICGCVVSIRAQACRIAMWVRSSEKNAFMAIGNQIKTILGLPPKKLEYTTHANAMKKTSSKSSASAVI